MADGNSEPTCEPVMISTRSRGRGRRGGRGRGRGGRGGARGYSAAAAAAATSSGINNSNAAKPAAVSRGRGGTRRGRVKNFSDSRVQAAYERQRDLKATYSAVAHALKPALQEISERNIELLMSNPDVYKEVPGYNEVMARLKSRLDDKLQECQNRLDLDLELAKRTFTAEEYAASRAFQSGVYDIMDQFYDGQENRLRILGSLHSKSLPVDIRDDQYDFTVISDAALDNEFGIYECHKNGYLVPYPSRVIGTEMWRKCREADAAVSSSSREPSSAPTRGRGRGRAGAGAGTKRRATDQPDGQSTPKKISRHQDDNQPLIPAPMAPAPVRGLLASAANVDERPEGPPADEDSVPASPEPPAGNGGNAALILRALNRRLARQNSPPLPKNLGDPDEHGVRTYSQRAYMRDRGINSRFFGPRPFTFDDWDIGFRDSSNDSSKGHTRAKRGKYLDCPNTSGIHYDYWCNSHDYTNTRPEDFDQDLVKKHGLHPTYGIFLPSSSNECEKPDPYVMPGRPKVFIANPSGRMSHASRSFQATINERRSDEVPLRCKMKADLRRFCKVADIDTGDISVADYVESDDQLRARSLGTADDELQSRPQRSATTSDEEEAAPPTPDGVEQPEAGVSTVSMLSIASAYVAAQDKCASSLKASKPARYDAIRDVFTNSEPVQAPAQVDGGVGLNFLAELCNAEPRAPRPSTDDVEPVAPATTTPTPAPAPVPELRTPSSAKNKELPPMAFLGQHPMSARLSQEAPPPLYSHRQPPPSSVHERTGYPMPQVLHEHKPAAYLPQPSPFGNPRPGPVDPDYNPRRLSNYGPDSSQPAPFSQAYWPPQSHSAGQSSPLPPIGGAPHSASPFSRLSFGQITNGEPLPPLRPSRSRAQSMQEEPVHEANLRVNSQGNYYPSPASRPYHHRGYPIPEAHQHSPPQHFHSDSLLPSTQHQGNLSYTGASPPAAGFTSHNISPTFANAPGLPGTMAQSPPGTPHGRGPGPAYRHRSTPSGSSDAGSKFYRKLQPAPVPANRTWPSKPELKTIPYDIRETGASAALPSSGPTYIRGWNVHQHGKRGKQDRGDSSADRDESR